MTADITPEKYALAFSPPEYNEPAPESRIVDPNLHYGQPADTRERVGGKRAVSEYNSDGPTDVPLRDVKTIDQKLAFRNTASADIMAMYRKSIPWLCRMAQRYYFPGVCTGLLSRFAAWVDREAYIALVLRPGDAAKRGELRREQKRRMKSLARGQKNHIRALRARPLFSREETSDLDEIYHLNVLDKTRDLVERVDQGL